MLDDGVLGGPAPKRLRQRIDVPWDEVRAARVHKRALEAFRQEPVEDDGADSDRAGTEKVQARSPSRSPRGWWIAACVAAAMVALLVLWPSPAPGPWQGASSLEFADGSRSLLSDRARVFVVRDEPARVEVRQEAGRVRYEIEPRPQREFVVQVSGVTVTVLGTIFEVSVVEGRVSVAVERGRVRVDGAETQVELTAGQTVELPRAIAEASIADTADEEEREVPEERAAPAGEATVSNDDVELDATGGDSQGASSDEAHAEATPPAASGSSAPGGKAPSAEALMAEADAARSAGDLGAAAIALEKLVSLHPADPKALLARFTLGRVYRQSGSPARSAQAFEACGDALRGDATAEAAWSWSMAGEMERSRRAAERYLAAHPDGVHAEAMRALSGAP